MKNITFNAGLHLVLLEGNTTPVDFLLAFGYGNQDLQIVNPGKYKELDLSKDCCPVILSDTSDGNAVIDLFVHLHNRAYNCNATIFVFCRLETSLPPTIEQDVCTKFTFDSATRGGVVLKSNEYPEGPYTIDNPIPKEHSEEQAEDPFEFINAESADHAPKETAETVVKIKDLVKTSRGFHRSYITNSNASALLRSDKNNTIVSASQNVQKGDYLVFSVENDIFNDLNEVVWEVTFVASIPHSIIPYSTNGSGFGQVCLSLKRLPNLCFQRGSSLGNHPDDCIIYR